MPTHWSILALKIPWTEEPGGCTRLHLPNFSLQPLCPSAQPSTTLCVQVHALLTQACVSQTQAATQHNVPWINRHYFPRADTANFHRNDLISVFFPSWNYVYSFIYKKNFFNFTVTNGNKMTLSWSQTDRFSQQVMTLSGTRWFHARVCRHKRQLLKCWDSKLGS